MPQRFVLPLSMTVEEYVQSAHLPQMPWWQSLWSAPDLAERDLLELLLRLEISHLRYRKLSSLSGGERQRLAVVRAILSQQEVLILDEPSSMLDAQSSSLVLDLLCELSIKQNRLIICSSHDPQWLKCPHARKLSLGSESAGGHRWC
jgi:ABC-type cobalamin/Fe3+-siderophores transport system ATPase subunit